MGGLSFWHILIFALVVLVLFGGKGKISDLMADFAKGIKSFRKGMEEEPEISLKKVQEKELDPIQERKSEFSEQRMKDPLS